ncbi:MAG: hypothetical protein PQJ61_10305 [Spirochaetales bacterium]|uniref:PKD domain-containing protein n=1 Tax=Candidatus Thalassospirochaeta sargassi TaxID=3119039 RepID=A0AAJ1IHB2_9SPIO|nr:hypothetical protein [Spirochaetales bacterium]
MNKKVLIIVFLFLIGNLVFAEILRDEIGIPFPADEAHEVLVAFTLTHSTGEEGNDGFLQPTSLNFSFLSYDHDSGQMDFNYITSNDSLHLATFDNYYYTGGTGLMEREDGFAVIISEVGTSDTSSSYQLRIRKRPIESNCADDKKAAEAGMNMLYIKFQHDEPATTIVNFSYQIDDITYYQECSVINNYLPSFSGINHRLSTDTDYKILFKLNNPTDYDDYPGNLTYRWKFTAGQTDPILRYDNDEFSHTYQSNTQQSVSVQIVDDDGNTTAWHSISVTPNSSPGSDIEPGGGSSGLRVISENNYAVTAPVRISLEPDIQDNESDSISKLIWNINGQNIEKTGSIDMFDTEYLLCNDPGIYTVSLQAVDEHLCTGNTDNITINVVPNYLAAFPSAAGLPWDSTKEPHLDGILDGPDLNSDCHYPTSTGTHDGTNESGWRGAYLYSYAYGTRYDTAFQLIKKSDNSQMYIGVDVNDDDTLASNDIYILGIRNIEGSTDRYSPMNADSDFLLLIDFAANELKIYSPAAGGGSWAYNASLTNEIVADSYAENKIFFDVKRYDPETKHWSFELKIPVNENGNWMGVSDNFLMFSNMMVNQTEPATCQQYIWPVENPYITALPAGADLIENYSLLPLWWGRGSLSGSNSTGGVFISSAMNIGITASGNLEDDLTNLIQPNVENTFVARIKNNSRKEIIYDFGDNNGPVDAVKMLPAGNLDVGFYLANWGIPPADADYWGLIPSAVNPVKVYINPGAENSQTGNVFPINGQPTPEENNVSIVGQPYFLNQHTHQCMMVKIEPSNDNALNTVISSKSIYRNMNFDTNDDYRGFSRKAAVSSLGYGLPPKGSTVHDVILRISPKTWVAHKNEMILAKEITGIIAEQIINPIPDFSPVYRKWKPVDSRNYDKANFGAVINKVEAHVSELPEYVVPQVINKPYIFDHLQIVDVINSQKINFIEYIVKAYRDTGKTIIVSGKKLTIVEPMGSYGHVIRHEGEIVDWEYGIVGAQAIGKNNYFISMKANSNFIIDNRIRAIPLKQ